MKNREHNDRNCALRSDVYRHDLESSELHTSVKRGPCVHFIHVRLLNTVEDIMYSNFLAANSREMNIRYIGVDRMMVKIQGVLLLLGKLVKDASVGKILGITHLDDPCLYISSEEDILLIIKAAYAIVKNDYKPAPLHAVSFYRRVRDLLDA